MRHSLVLGFSILIAMASGAWGQGADQTADRLAQIERRIDTAMPAAGAPGVAWALVENGQVHAGASGEIRRGSGQPVTPDTPFVIGSISKSFTAVAVLQLVEAGEVDLDGAISDYLPDFAGQAGADITVRQLLSHTSGYSTLQGNESYSGRAGRGEGLAIRVANLAAMTPAAAPGTAWLYSNGNYLILGRLIETVSGRDFATYIESEILAPIGMINSFVGSGGAGYPVAVGHSPWFAGTRPVSERSPSSERPQSLGMAPAGGIVASAADLGRYLAVIMNGEDDVLTAQSKALMLSPAGPVSPFYGLGWAIDQAAGTASHTGLSPGVETIATMSPTGQRGALVLVNRNSGMGFGVTVDLLYGVTADGMGQPYEPFGSSIGAASFFLFLVALPLFFVAGICGAWILRRGLRAKAGLPGQLSLWFPLVAVLAMSAVFLFIVPRLFGVPLGTLQLYQPDMVLLLYLGSITGIALAVFRLSVFYFGRDNAATSRSES